MYRVSVHRERRKGTSGGCSSFADGNCPVPRSDPRRWPPPCRLSPPARTALCPTRTAVPILKFFRRHRVPFAETFANSITIRGCNFMDSRFLPRSFLRTFAPPMIDTLTTGANPRRKFQFLPGLIFPLIFYYVHPLRYWHSRALLPLPLRSRKSAASIASESKNPPSRFNSFRNWTERLILILKVIDSLLSRPKISTCGYILRVF